MRFTVFSAGTRLGTSNLEHLDHGMGVASGGFSPEPGYASVSRVFRKYGDAHGDDGTLDQPLLERLWQERDALGLRVVAPDGSDLLVAWVMIYDFGEEAGKDGYRIDVCLESQTDIAAYWPQPEST